MINNDRVGDTTYNKPDFTFKNTYCNNSKTYPNTFKINTLKLGTPTKQQIEKCQLLL